MTQTHVTLAKDVISTQLLGQETLLLHLHRGDYYTLNETGALLWQGFQQQQSLATLSQTLAAHYGLPLEEATKHVLQLVDQLAAAGLVQRQ